MSIRFSAAIGEAALGALLAIAGGALALMAHRLPASTDPGVPGAGGIPFFLGLMIAGLGLLIALKGLISRHGQPIELGERKAMLSILLLGGFVALLAPLGFLLTSTLFLFLGFWALGGTDWRRSAGVAGLASGALWLIFTRLLGVGLPDGRIVAWFFQCIFEVK